MSLPKSKLTFRMYCQNVNGIQLDEVGGDFSHICTTTHTLQCDLVGICETKLDTSKYAVRKIIDKTLRSQHQCHRVANSTSSIPFEGYYKPGGTMTYCVNHNTSRFHSKFEDTLGRWSTISMVGKKGRVIHFITLYQVVDKATKGPFTAYQQQLTILCLDDRKMHPRQALLLDFDRY